MVGRRHRFGLGAAVNAAAVVVLVAVVAVAASPTRFDQLALEGGRGGPGGSAGESGGPPDEAAEQAETVALRLAALNQARRSGQVGQVRPLAAPAAPGWAGETPIDPSAADDWEPAIAADPSAPWVYALVTRYGDVKPCKGNCPTPYIALFVSANGGTSWAPAKPLCACKGSGQFDPIIEVVPGTGQVYAAYMNGFNVMFTRSTDHGATWSAPVKTYGNVSWNDKPVLAMSDDGRDVYVAFNGPTGGDPYVAQSHDFGTTWSQTKLVDSTRYLYAFDADVAPDGTVYLAQSSLLYSGNATLTGQAEHHVFVSRDRGASWEDRLVDTVELGPVCSAAGCPSDFYVGHSGLSVDAAGAVALVYDGASVPGGPQSIRSRRSTDAGRTWIAGPVLSTPGEQATSPALESRGVGDVRAWWMETAGGNVDAWNVWFRTSTNGGASWSAAVRLSDAGGGAAYKTPAGFLEVYGDYGELAITSTGKAIAIWGEGASYAGPGGVWFNRQT